MANITNLSIKSVIADLIVLICLAAPLLIFEIWIEPNKRGFYCDDESIRYPYKESTVSRYLLIVIGLLIPASLILLTEILRALAWERRISHQLCSYRFKEYIVHRIFVRLYVFMGYFLLGVCFNQLMVDIAKYTIGRQRPHFLEVCMPVAEKELINLNRETSKVIKDFRSNCPADEHSYITEFKCVGDDQDKIKEAQLSFYSGHSAFSFYAAWYTSLYLQARLYQPLGSELVRPFVQFLLFCGAAFVSYSRVSDYKHHWSDVLVGIIIGSAIGIINALFIAEVFQRCELPAEFKKRKIIGKFAKKEGDVEMGNLNDGHTTAPLNKEFRAAEEASGPL